MSESNKAALLTVVALLVGLWIGGHPRILPSFVSDVLVEDRPEIATDAFNEIKANYYRPVKGLQLDNYAANGMIHSLRRHYNDRFSHYFTPEEFEAFQDSIHGEFSGVGLTVTEVPRGLRVSKTIKDSPADDAGIKPDDLVTAVNGKSIAGTSSEVSTARIQGEAGTKVTVTVVTPGQKPRDLTLERARISVPVIATHMLNRGGRKIGYVRLVSFTDDVGAAVRARAEQLYRDGAEGLIFDLRGNGGGQLLEAVRTSSDFVENGTIVTIDGRAEERHVFKAVGDALPRHPMVVLIDRNTASASEITTAALVDHRVATAVGTRSFGKGVFQHVIPLAEGAGLDLTVGEYFTPKGVSLAGHGIDPSVRAPDNPKTHRDEGIAAALRVLDAKLNR